MRFFSCRVLLGSAICALLATTALAKDIGGNGKAQAPRYGEDVFPPWQHGANNDAANRFPRAGP
jgi:molybdate transport system substrate-binding protein